jgi:hypothetical protein
MPALPNVPGVIKMTIDWGVEANVLAQTIHHWEFTGSATAGDMTAFAVNAQGAADAAAPFVPLASDQVGMLAITVRDLTSDMGVEVSGGTPWLGTRGAALTSPGTAVLVRHQIARHYRGGQPRSYLPLGVSGDIATSGLWSDAFVNAVNSAWGSWVSSNTGPIGGLTIASIANVSYYKGFTPFTTPSGRVKNRPNLRATPLVDAFTGHTTSKTIASQRRRNRDA